MARYLYSELASTIDACRRCSNDLPRMAEWYDKHKDAIESLVSEHMPSGSGFDCGTALDYDESHAEKLVFTTSFRHMNDTGYYDGWTEHTITVTPSFSGFNLRISGRNRNEIKDCIRDCFRQSLMAELPAVTRDGKTVKA